MKKELKQIMELSFPFCKNDNDQIALYFQKINSLAHDAEVYMENKGLNKESHQTEEHHKS